MVYEMVRVGPYKIFLSTPSSHTGPGNTREGRMKLELFFLDKTMWQICAKLHHEGKSLAVLANLDTAVLSSFFAVFRCSGPPLSP